MLKEIKMSLWVFIHANLWTRTFTCSKYVSSAIKKHALAHLTQTDSMEEIKVTAAGSRPDQAG